MAITDRPARRAVGWSGSILSIGSVVSGFSRWSLLSWRARSA